MNNKLNDNILIFQNEQIRKYYYRTIVLFTNFFPILYIVLVFALNYKHLNDFKVDYKIQIYIQTLISSIFDTIGLLILIIIFNIKKTRDIIKNLLLNSIVLKKNKQKNSIHHTFQMLKKFFLILLFFTFIIFTPGVLRYSFFYEYTFKFFNIVGLILSLFILSLISLFLITLLPELIIKKIEKENHTHSKYRFIYWMYFLESRLVESPVIIVVAFPLLVSMLIFLTCLPILPIEGEKARIMITSIGILLTLTTTILSDFLRAYTKLPQVFNDYSSHLIKNRLILVNSFSIVLIGIGNYGSSIINSLFIHHLHWFKKLFQKNNHLNDKFFKIIIDRDYDLRLLSSYYLIIENNVNKFEEVYSDSASNLKFGFLTSLHYFNNGEENDIDYKCFGIPGIVADGSNLGIWNIINFIKNPVIINASSDKKLPFILNKYLEYQIIKELISPIVFTTVSSQFVEYQLINNNITKYKSFPINYSFYESKNIIQRVFFAISKIGFDNLSKIELIVSCQENSVIEIINNIKSLVNIIDSSKSKQFIEHNVIIHLHAKNYYKSTSYNHFPVFMSESFKTIEIDDFHSIEFKISDKTIYDKIKKDKNDFQNQIFILFAEDELSSLYILNEMKNIILSLSLNSYIITSISEDYLEEARLLLKQISKKENIFPCFPDDFLLKKNLTISNQIFTMVSALQKEIIIKPNKEVHAYNKHSPLNSKDELFQLEACLVNEPIEYFKVLCKLKGFKLTSRVKSNVVVPNFLFNFSFPSIGIRSDYDSFTFRADFTLVKINPFHELNSLCLNGIFLNPSENDNLFLNSFNLNNKLCHKSCVSCKLNKNRYYQDENIVKDKIMPTGFGYVKVISKNYCRNNSLINILKHLFYGIYELNQSIKSKSASNNNKAINILYETGTICSYSNKYIHKFCFNYSEEQNENKSMISDLTEIIFHFSNPEDENWKQYKKIIINYFKEFEFIADKVENYDENSAFKLSWCSIKS